MNHGHVTPNADGSRARCGGPGLCPECSVELVQQSKLIESGNKFPPRCWVDTDRTIKHSDLMVAWPDYAASDERKKDRTEYVSLAEHKHLLREAINESMAGVFELASDMTHSYPEYVKLRRAFREKAKTIREGKI